LIATTPDEFRLDAGLSNYLFFFITVNQQRFTASSGAERLPHDHHHLTIACSSVLVQTTLKALLKWGQIA
jgi:hypothetical protein